MATTAIDHGRQIRKSWLAAAIASTPWIHLVLFGALVLRGAIEVNGMPSSDGPDPAGLGALYDLATISLPIAIAAAPLLLAVALVSPVRRDLWLRRAIVAAVGLVGILIVMTVDPSGLWTWSTLPG